jgi:hypothetical protein
VAKLKFGGEEYDYVEFGTLTLGEALILHEYSGLTLDEVQDAGFHPGLIMALIHISVARQSSIRKQDLRKRVEGLLMADLEQVFEDVGVEADEQEEDARPPASPVPSGEPPVTDEQPRKPASPEPTGDDGEQSSENPASILRAIGSPG